MKTEHAGNPRIGYGAYTDLLSRLFLILGAYYGKTESSELESMKIYAEKLQRTVSALRLKYAYSPSWRYSGEMEIADSGFPACSDITQISLDLSTKGERLPKFFPAQRLKEKILDLLMSERASAEAANEQEKKLNTLLWQFADRTYLEMLDLRTMFLKFTPGKVYLAPGVQPRKENRMPYYLSWACYDSETNLPYVYIMLFEHEREGDNPPLEAGGPELVALYEAVESIGTRAPQELRAIGIMLDETLQNIYPLVIKRNKIGPIYSPLFSLWNMGPHSFPRRMSERFGTKHLTEKDFILLFETEIVLSKKEEMPHSIFSFGKQKARQIFHVPKTDRDLMRRGSTSVSRFALMPHRFRQHLTAEDRALFPEFSGDMQFLTYDQEGRVEHVG